VFCDEHGSGEQPEPRDLLFGVDKGDGVGAKRDPAMLKAV
jgi:hypothetical protein